ncbi:MAG: hypothetical protein ACRC62_19110 [Microcoleus sp.]
MMLISSAPRMDGETESAYAAFLCYEALSAPRSIDVAYRNYMAKRERATKVNGEDKRRASASFHAWRKQYNWDDRVAPADQAAKERAIAITTAMMVEADTVEADMYKRQIEQYVKRSRMLAEQSMAICINVKGEMTRFLAKKPEIKNWQDAATAARLVSALEASGVELGRQSLFLQPLIEVNVEQ